MEEERSDFRWADRRERKMPLASRLSMDGFRAKTLTNGNGRS